MRGERWPLEVCMRAGCERECGEGNTADAVQRCGAGCTHHAVQQNMLTFSRRDAMNSNTVATAMAQMVKLSVSLFAVCVTLGCLCHSWLTENRQSCFCTSAVVPHTKSEILTRNKIK